MNRLLCALALALGLGLSAGTAADEALEKVLASPHRGDSAARDAYRHPAETLKFFEVEPDHTVVEIWPGGGWYTQVLAPWLKPEGTFYAAHFNPDSTSEFFRNARSQFEARLAASPEQYSKVIVTSFNPPEHVDIAPPGSADRVLTFRNVHNWYMRGGGDARVLAAFHAFYQALKPGGVLGVVEHRLPADRPATDMEASGYMHEAYVVGIAQQAGFELVGSSDINANPKDSADHPKGVWTLPPSLRLGEEQREYYLGIGESDRMTLKFRKPE